MNSSQKNLHALYNPGHIVIVGFSRDESKEPAIFLRELLNQGYKGKISLLGRERGQFQGCEMYDSAAALPEGIDLAFNMVAAGKTLDILPQVAARGVPAAVIFTSGFAEMDPSGADLQRKLVEACNANGMRVVGPNCPGYFYLPNGINLTGIPDIPQGPIGLISQSGNVGITLWDQAKTIDIGFSAFVGVGNQADIPIHDHIEYLGQDDNTKVIALYLEGLPDGHGPRFVSVCRDVSRRKPIVALKGGRTVGGMRAAQSHTAAMSSASKVYSALFKDCGVIEVAHLEHLLPIAEVLYRCPPMKGRRVAIVGSGGGHSTVSTDEVELAGLTVPEFNSELQAEYGKRLPSYAPKRNPVDMTGGFTKDPTRFAQMTELVLAHDPNFDGFINYGLYGFYRNGKPPADAVHTYESAGPVIGHVQARSGLPVIFYTPYAYRRDPAYSALRNAGIPCYPNIHLAALGLAALYERNQLLTKAADTDAKVDGPAETSANPALHGTGITEATAVAYLSGFGIRFPKLELCQTGDEAAVAAKRIGFPVVLKAVLPGVMHKSDVGGVAVGLSSSAAVSEAATTMTGHVTAALGAGRQDGFLVSEDLGKRRELFVGVRKDSLMGAIGLVGFGGVYAEAVNDTAICLLPATPARVAACLERLQSKSMWTEFRGEPAVAPAKIAALLNALDRALAADRLTAIECNPVMIVGGDLIAVDAAIETTEVA
ncbi:acetate--CoA ligase family protein [Bosea sp. OK403]|uniref:acetate--CoA ligase family protein n=1 Tax=Bosea sp. OK403 TaxID=1855286 RepID=UPI001FCD0627|nr:acetate--CoA ligase family protein [Bosea sp. OK403]